VNLCRELSEIGKNGTASANPRERHSDEQEGVSQSERRRQAVADECRTLEEKLRVLNRRHAALLRRSGHSLRIFARLLDSTALAYSVDVQSSPRETDEPCPT
jgi:hypothetical protein